MNDSEKDKEQLLQELNYLRQKVIELERQRPFSHQDSLKIAVVESAPFSLWACDRNFKIVIWNEQAEKVYKHSKHEAMGKDFVDLFVDEPEQEQARIDCLAIIDQDVKFKNFLANDKDRYGNTLTMLTNCFRIWDEETQQYLQAEIGLEISDLGESQMKHRTLRELGMESVALRKRNLDLERRSQNMRLVMVFHEKLSTIDEKIREERDTVSRLIRSGEFTREQAEHLVKDNLEALNNAKRAIKELNENLLHSILDARTVEELDELGLRITEFEGTNFTPETHEY